MVTSRGVDERGPGCCMGSGGGAVCVGDATSFVVGRVLLEALQGVFIVGECIGLSG